MSEKIRSGIRDLFRVNLGVCHGERIMVLANYPTQDDWRRFETDRLREEIGRTLAAKMIGETAQRLFPWLDIDFWAYPATEGLGVEPPDEILQRMRCSDVVLGVTASSILHTAAREELSRRGSRVCCMFGFDPEMFYPGGPMAVDYVEIAGKTDILAALLSDAPAARVTSRAGTDIWFGLAGCEGFSDNGVYEEAGSWGALPAGEASITPTMGTTQGRLIVEPRWNPPRSDTEEMVLSGGRVVSVEGTGQTTGCPRNSTQLNAETVEEALGYNLIEFGIGTNPNARNIRNSREREKIKGTVHFVFHSSNQRTCVVVNKPSVWLGEKQIMESGAWLF